MDTTTLPATCDTIRWIALIGSFACIIIGMFLVFSRLKAKEQGFGSGSLRAIGIVIFIPSLLILPIIIPSFHTDTLAALLGTVAGYVLSKDDEQGDNKKNTKKHDDKDGKKDEDKDDKKKVDDHVA